jgi:hypothetical protein
MVLLELMRTSLLSLTAVSGSPTIEMEISPETMRQRKS